MYTHNPTFIIALLTVMIIGYGINNCIRALALNFDYDTHRYWVSAIFTTFEIAVIYIVKFKYGYRLEFKTNWFVHGILSWIYLYTGLFRFHVRISILGNNVCYLDRGELFYTFCYAFPIAFWGCRLLIE